MSKVYVTNDVKRMFIAAFREIFAHDADFPYNKTDIARGKILITDKYSTPKTESKVPQIIFSTVSYNANVTSMAFNFKEEIPGSITAGVTKNSLKKYSNIVQFQLTVDCVSSVKAECELVADKIFNSLCIEDVQLFDALSLNIRGVSIGEAIPRNQYPEYQFIATVTIIGDFMIQWVMEPTSRHPLLTAVQTEMQQIVI